SSPDLEWLGSSSKSSSGAGFTGVTTWHEPASPFGCRVAGVVGSRPSAWIALDRWIPPSPWRFEPRPTPDERNAAEQWEQAEKARRGVDLRGPGVQEDREFAFGALQPHEP